MSHLVAIVGPTGVGKSLMALHLAQVFNGEMVSADSRQVYRYMDIGTAKPTSEELSLVPHHLISIVDPDEGFSLAQYKELAFKTIEDIQKRDKLPFLVGGTGLYVWSAIEGWEIPAVPPDLEYRKDLENKANAGEDLYQLLMQIDPEAAQKIDRRNVRRVIRALEVCRQAQAPFSRLHRKKPPPFDTLIIGLTTDRAELYRRIDARVEEMIKLGLIAEVEKLLKMGYDFKLPAMSGIGYKQIGMYLRGELTLDEAVLRIKAETHRFVRHQYNWFKLDDDRIHWFDVREDIEDKVKALIAGFIETNQKSGLGG